MSRVANKFIDDVDQVLRENYGVCSLKHMSEKLSNSWCLSYDEEGAETLQNLGFHVSYLWGEYFVGIGI